MSQSKEKPKEFMIEEALGRSVIAIASHPFDLVKILIQLGYEPLLPVASKSIFGKPRLKLPNVFTYMGYIRGEEGFVGLFRGCSYKIAATLINGYVYVGVNNWQKSAYPIETDESTNEENKEEGNEENSVVPVGLTKKKIQRLIERLARDTCCRFLALSVSYPFHVMTIRVCAQFVGKETDYNTMTGAITDIYQTGGILGFYSGFMPKFLGDCLVLWLSSSIVFVINSQMESHNAPIKGYVTASVNFIVTSLLYPFQLVSTIMACNGPSARTLAASHLTGRDYKDWLECWSHLDKIGEIKRGSSLFWRYKPMPRFYRPGKHYNNE